MNLPDLHLEQTLWQGGIMRLAGLDEAGRGAWAGPVAAAAVILPADPHLTRRLDGVRDSKQMTPRQRARWADEIRQLALAFGVGMATNEEIDAMGIVAATRLAMLRALQALPLTPDHLLLDALILPEAEQNQTALIKGDCRCLSIAAASVLAKTSRDQFMQGLEEIYPGYAFGRHKGYGTRLHRLALRQKGPCDAHRFSFAPLRACELHLY